LELTLHEWRHQIKVESLPFAFLRVVVNMSESHVRWDRFELGTEWRQCVDPVLDVPQKHVVYEKTKSCLNLNEVFHVYLTEHLVLHVSRSNHRLTYKWVELFFREVRRSDNREGSANIRPYQALKFNPNHIAFIREQKLRAATSDLRLLFELAKEDLTLFALLPPCYFAWDWVQIEFWIKA
jgi:hypothetical protein